MKSHSGVDTQVGQGHEEDSVINDDDLLNEDDQDVDFSVAM
jgi:hypothetical protein